MNNVRERAPNAPSQAPPVKRVGGFAPGLAALCLSLGIAAAAGWFGDSRFTFLSNVVIAGYLIWALRRSRGQGALASRLGENAYFVGYLTTIVGFCAVAAEVYQNPKLLESQYLPQLLMKGASAVTTTIGGLVAMNILKLYAQSLPVKREQDAELVERLLTEFGRRLGDSQVDRDAKLLDLMQSALQSSQVAERMQALATNLEAGAQSLGGMQQTFQAANGTVEALAKRMAEIEGAAKNFVDMSRAAAPVWQQIGGNLQQAAEFSQVISSLTTQLAQFEGVLKTAAEHLQDHLTASANQHEAIKNQLGTLQEKIQQITPMSEAVDKFVQLAKEVAPTLQIVGQNFSKLDHVKTNIDELVRSLGQFNTHLTAADGAMVKVSGDQERMSRTTDDLVKRLQDDLGMLQALTSNLKGIAETAQTIRPGMDVAEGNIRSLSEVMQELTGLHGAVKSLIEAVMAASGSVKEIVTAIQNYSELMRNASAHVDEHR